MNETQELFGNVSNLSMHRRSLLKSGGVLAALFAMTGKVHAWQDSSAPDIVFDDYYVDVPYWQAGTERYSMSGRFGVDSDNVLTGEAVMTFPDGSKGTLNADEQIATVIYESGRLDYEADPDQPERLMVRVNDGDLQDVTTLLARLEAENQGTGSAAFSDVGRAILVVGGAAAAFEYYRPA